MIETPYSLKGKRVWVAGHRGMVGSALVRRLAKEDCEIVTVDRAAVDLRSEHSVDQWIASVRPETIFVAAATVGGILANDSRPVDFLHDNLMIECNVMAAAHRSNVEKLIFLGSSCIYPRAAPQPMAEAALLTGPLEPTNQWYAIAKIAGIKLAQAYRLQFGCDFISAMPTNLYGPGDTVDLLASHVVPALMAKAHSAKVNKAPAIEVWGTGAPLREFLYCEDLADALVFISKHYSEVEHINVGSGVEISISELARLICRIVGYSGSLEFLSSRPDGMPRKLLDVSRLKELGWQASTSLEDGLARTYQWFCEAKA